MCILIAKPAGKPVPSISKLHNCHLNNPDGMGYAVPGRVYKTLDFGDFIREISKEDPDLPMIIHFRWATHGSVCRANCHPFYDGATGVAFAHNGILPVQAWTGRTDSETAFRELFVPAVKRSGLGKGLTRAVNRVLGSSKVAFLTDFGALRTYGDFIDDEGVLYSNFSFLRRPAWSYPQKSAAAAF